MNTQLVGDSFVVLSVWTHPSAVVTRIVNWPPTAVLCVRIRQQSLRIHVHTADAMRQNSFVSSASAVCIGLKALHYWPAPPSFCSRYISILEPFSYGTIENASSGSTPCSSGTRWVYGSCMWLICIHRVTSIHLSSPHNNQRIVTKTTTMIMTGNEKWLSMVSKLSRWLTIYWPQTIFSSQISSS